MTLLATLETPCLILDRSRLAHNATRMTDRFANSGVQLRPHMKTGKSIDVARVALAGNFGGVTVSTALLQKGSHATSRPSSRDRRGREPPGVRPKQRRQRLGEIAHGHALQAKPLRQLLGRFRLAKVAGQDAGREADLVLANSASIARSMSLSAPAPITSVSASGAIPDGSGSRVMVSLCMWHILFSAEN